MRLVIAGVIVLWLAASCSSGPYEALDESEPHATFHDAGFASIAIDYAASQLVAQLELCVGNPEDPDAEARERRRVGTLVFEGVALRTLEPGLVPGRVIRLTSDGPLDQAPTEEGKRFAAKCRGSKLAWFLFFGELNAYGYVAGASVDTQNRPLIDT